MSATKTPDPTVMAMFTGSENWYRHGLARSILYSDGAKYIAETAGAYWLLDEIALTQFSEAVVNAEEFQVWTLTVRADHTGTLTCGDGNDRAVYSKELEYTDFPEPGVTLWFQNKTIFLPTEY